MSYLHAGIVLSPVEKRTSLVPTRETRSIKRDSLDRRRPVQLFQIPICESELVPVHVTAAIFGNIGEIVGVNAELLRDLRSREVGAAFLRIAPFLKLYSTYAKSHERALATLLVRRLV